MKINCVLDFEEEIAEAKEVLFQVDELNAAMNLRIGLEEEKEKEASGILNATGESGFRVTFFNMGQTRLFLYFDCRAFTNNDRTPQQYIEHFCYIV